MVDRLFDWLFDALRAQFDPYLAPLWTSLNFWRGAGLVLVALVVAAVILLVKQRHRITAFLRRDEQRQHDRAILAEADKLLPEAALMNTLRTLSGQHAYTSDQLQKVTSFGYYFDETGHHYLDKSIGDATVRLLRSLNDLLEFMAQYFTVYGIQPEQRGARLCMLPSLNIDREGDPADTEGQARYHKHARELDEFIGAVTESYQDYRKIVKTRLAV